jgi:DNA-binding CsgD family transcriptional regulator/tetratricopeptide (TPR) repeat protein
MGREGLANRSVTASGTESAGAGSRAYGNIVGRQQERDMLDRLISDLDHGGAALVFHGEPGIGKTALLDYVARQAQRIKAMSVLRVRGIESETVLPFAALADLLLPFRRQLEGLPTLQRRSLEASLSLSDGPEGGSRNAFAGCLAALNVLVAASEAQPRLVLVDDFQWIDLASRQVLLFIARRLLSERVAMVIAARDEPPTTSVFGDLPATELAGISDPECAELLSRRGLGPAPRVLDELARLSRGNPSVLIETASALNASQLRGDEAIPDLLRVSRSLDRIWLARFGDLPEPTLDALTVLAASRSTTIGDLEAALVLLGLSVAALGPAERIGLVVAGPTAYEFRHPVLRPLILNRRTLEQKLIAFKALAGASRGALRAWYRAAATSGPDEDVAGDLAAAASEARRRSAFESASLAWRRAAELTARPTTKAIWLRRAAEDAFLVGRSTQASGLCGDALSIAADPPTRADIELLRGRIHTWLGRPTEAHELLTTASQAIRKVDPGRASQLLIEAVFPALISSQIADARRAAEEGAALAVASGVSSLKATLALAQVRVVAGQVAEACDLIDSATEVLQRADPVLEAQTLTITGHCYTMADRQEAGRRLLTRVIEAARHASAPAALAYALAARSEVDAWSGQVSSAYIDASEAVAWADELGQRSALGYALMCLARIHAIRGDLAQCNEHIARADRDVDRFDVRIMAAYAPALAGFAEVSRGAYEAAVDHLVQAYDIARQIGLGNPMTPPFAADLVEAYVRVGDREGALDVLDWLERCAAVSGLTWATAVVERCQGLLATSFVECRRHFDNATVAHRRQVAPFEQARTYLCRGEMFRRFRRPGLARVPLRAALDTFRALGAQLWAKRTEVELGAAGDRQVLRVARPLLELLTPQELQVARAIVRGLNNPEVAASLFVSRKTVEAHLTRVYRKLGVRSRTDLTRLLVEVDAAD